MARKVEYEGVRARGKHRERLSTFPLLRCGLVQRAVLAVMGRWVSQSQEPPSC
jgi:hypothetical protein